MKPEEVKSELIDIYEHAVEYHDGRSDEAVDMAVEALNKQIPKKPKIRHYEEEGEPPYTKICCPNGCHVQLYPVTEKRLAHEHVYCPSCGQAIDWSEVKDEC